MDSSLWFDAKNQGKPFVYIENLQVVIFKLYSISFSEDYFCLSNIVQTLMKYCIFIGVAPITQLCTCAIKIVIFKGGHLMW